MSKMTVRGTMYNHIQMMGTQVSM